MVYLRVSTPGKFSSVDCIIRVDDESCAGKASHWTSISPNHSELYSNIIYLASYFLLRTLAQKPTRTSVVTPILVLGGLYHPSYRRLSTVGALNTLIAPLMSYDFVYRAHFYYTRHYTFPLPGLAG